MSDAHGPVSGAALQVQPHVGRLLGPVVEVSPGRYDVPWVAPVGTDEELFTVRTSHEGPYDLRLHVEPLTPAPLGVPRELDVAPGADRIQLHFPASDPPRPADVVVGYYTLASGRISVNILPERGGLPARMPLPTTLLGRLAVDRTWQGRGLGAALLAHALRVAVRNVKHAATCVNL